MVPCNQCTVKHRYCEYPPKFRSIKVEQLVVDGIPTGLPGSEAILTPSVTTQSGLPTAPNSSSFSPSSGGSPHNTEAAAVEVVVVPAPVNGQRIAAATASGIRGKTIEERPSGVEALGQLTLENAMPAVLRLNKENEALKLKIRDLQLKNKRQRTKLKKVITGQVDGEEASNEEDDDEANGDVNKNGLERFENEVKPSSIYYGPNSTRYMIASSRTKGELSEFDDFVKVKRQIKQKRDLPTLVHPKANSAKAKLIAKRKNMEAIVGLLKKFFHMKVYYMNFLSPEPLIELFERYDTINEWDKSDDDKLLLSIMIIIVSMRSLPVDEPLLRKYNLSYHKNRDSLYKQYKNLKRGIQIETTTSLRAYVLECEDLFYNDQIEKSWSLLFQLVSSAYSLGLHVYDESIVKTLKAEQHEKSGDVIKKNPKTSLWLVINFISATLCSVLGRPNPVTFNFQPLFKNYEIRLNYKIALADLVKKSTNILIDSYKIPIDLDTVLDIDESFVNEVLIYEKILIDTRIMRNMKSRDITKPSFITLPVIDKSGDHPIRNGNCNNNKNNAKGNSSGVSNSVNANGNGNTDGNEMIYATATVGVQHTCSGKRSKPLSQRNLSRLVSDCPLDIRFTILRPCPFQHEEEPWCLITQDADTLCDLIMLYGNRAKFHQHFMSKYSKSLENCLASILKVLEHTQDLVELMMKKFGEPSFERVHPFFYVFLHQTFVVTYTLMHLGYAKLSAYYNEIGMIRQRLIKLFHTVGPQHWRSNVARIIQYINDMCDNFFKAYLEKEQLIPKSATLPPMSDGNKDMMVHPATFQIQHERLQQEKERRLHLASPSSADGDLTSANYARCGTPTSLNPMFQPNSSLNSPSGENGTETNGESLFPGLQVHKVPDEIRTNLSLSAAPSNGNTPAVQSAPMSNSTPTCRTPTVVLPSLPAQSYLSGNPTSLSQISLLNYDMEYYNPALQFFPPPQSDAEPQQASAQQSVQPQTRRSQQQEFQAEGVQSTFTIDPLLGFDLNDPFFVQNPFNFNYAYSPSVQNGHGNAATANSDAADFIRNDSVMTMTTGSNEMMDRSSSDGSLK
ncbi:DEKNAAC103210 [Brettanomyces naardenensis]|uniref:DEKNAAC103210 n=1 Tax=Brettanomyces naardenensis TaxID=13370 RepID=A0A448YMT4_BRENA|nr:DEKNAAC103210 [Brettanomyces naardenensis]